MASKVCLEPGCNKPRMTTNSGRVLQRCEEHQREDWRRRKAKETKAKQKRQPVMAYKPAVAALPQGETCPVCGRDATQAAAWALAGVVCIHCQASPARVTPRTDGSTALMIDVQRDKLSRVAVTVLDEQPMPGAADLRLAMLEAERNGMLIVRRHQMTAGNGSNV